MPRTTLARPLALILGAAILAVAIISPRSEAQFTASPQPIGNWWPPHPRDHVQFYGDLDPLGPQAQQVLYTVPSDKWLVLLPTGIPAQLWIGNAGALRLFELRQGQLYEKADADDYSQGNNVKSMGPSPGSMFGWTFAPGSQVVLKNTSTTSATMIAPYSMFGYLAPL